jgi:hypothetical protein
MMRLWNESVYVAILIHPKKESMIYHTWDEYANYYVTYMVLHIEITIISSKYFCIRFFDSFVGFVSIHLIDWLIDWCLTPTLAVFQLYRGVSI